MNAMFRFAAVGLAGAFIAACAVKKKPPEITFDDSSFAPAVIEKAPIDPVEIVELPTPLPLPGQLKPVGQHQQNSPQATDPNERVRIANAAARMAPERDGYINAMQVYPYAHGALYQLYTAPEQVSDIALQAGEKLVSVSAGDTLRWVVGDTKSGQGDSEQAHILIKPTEPDLKTNLIITTDRRHYHLELESFAETYLASFSWRYPQV